MVPLTLPIQAASPAISAVQETAGTNPGQRESAEVADIFADLLSLQLGLSSEAASAVATAADTVGLVDEAHGHQSREDGHSVPTDVATQAEWSSLMPPVLPNVPTIVAPVAPDSVPAKTESPALLAPAVHMGAGSPSASFVAQLPMQRQWFAAASAAIAASADDRPEELPLLRPSVSVPNVVKWADSPQESAEQLSVPHLETGAAQAARATAVPAVGEVDASILQSADKGGQDIGYVSPAQAPASQAVLPQQSVAGTIPIAPVAPAMVAHAPPAPSFMVTHPVASPGWGGALGEHVVWMVGQQHQGVELHLNPAALGPLEVKLSISDGQANLSFATQHAPVREAIEAATPRLREMLADSGISLGSVSVNVGSFAQSTPGEQAQRQLPAWVGARSAADFSSLLPAAVTVLGHKGMVDIFA